VKYVVFATLVELQK